MESSGCVVVLVLAKSWKLVSFAASRRQCRMEDQEGRARVGSGEVLYVPRYVAVRVSHILICNSRPADHVTW